MISEQSKQLLLIDEDNNKSYTLNVSPEEYEEASTDPDYGAILLVAYLNAGRPIRIEDIHLEENVVDESCNDENMAANYQNNQPFRVEIPEVVTADEPFNVTCNKNKSAEQPTDYNSTAYNWKEDETFLLIDCYQKEGVHLLIRKQDISAALERFIATFNTILLEKKGNTIPYSKCCSKIDSLQRLYREKFDLKNKSGGVPCNWPYFKALHKLFHKENWVKPLSVAGSGIPASLAVEVAEPRPKQTKPLQFLLEEISVDRRRKREIDEMKHKEKMCRLDRFNDNMESMAQSFSVIAAAKKARVERDNN